MQLIESLPPEDIEEEVPVSNLNLPFSVVSSEISRKC